jgi:hypothetical protein
VSLCISFSTMELGMSSLTSVANTCPALFVKTRYMSVPCSGNICGYCLCRCASRSASVDDWLYAPPYVEPRLRPLTNLDACDGGLNLSGCSRLVCFSCCDDDAHRFCCRGSVAQSTLCRQAATGAARQVVLRSLGRLERDMLMPVNGC